MPGLTAGRADIEKTRQSTALTSPGSSPMTNSPNMPCGPLTNKLR